MAKRKKSPEWFSVDRIGLRKLVADRPRRFAAWELLSNAFDEPGVTRVDVDVRILDGQAQILVEDNAPNGFQDMAHAWTIYAESKKKADATLRGRFNRGEKLVLALAETAMISSTRGTVHFGPNGRRSSGQTRHAGTSVLVSFAGKRDAEKTLRELRIGVLGVVPPAGVVVTLDGKDWGRPKPVASAEVVELPTVRSDDEGVLRQAHRDTVVTVYDAPAGKEGTLFERGIPVVEIGGRFDVDVGARVPLNSDRDNVTPGYLARIRAEVLNLTVNLIGELDAVQPWIKDAAGHQFATEEAVKKVMDLRFGKNRVAYDLNDEEAVHRATAEGYAVVHGGSLTGAEWAQAKRAGAILPAGKVFPTPKPYGETGPPVKVLSLDEQSDGMLVFTIFAKKLAENLIGKAIEVRFVSTDNAFAACYGGARLDLNVKKLGRTFFERPFDDVDVLSLLIHEFGHDESAGSSNHLSEKYHEALCMLGAKLSRLAASGFHFDRGHYGR